MSTESPFVAMLESSRTEQLPVSIYLSYHIISGIVTDVQPTFVELRTDDGKRCVIALDKIKATSAS